MATGRNHTQIEVCLNLNVRGMQPSATLAINERCAELRRQGKQVYRLGLGQSPFPVPESVVEALRANAHQKAYLPVRGLAELREAVAEYHRRTQGMPCDGSDVLIGPGSKELMFILQLVYYGDLVIPRPSWVSYAPQANIIGRNVRWITTDQDDNWRLTPEHLEELVAEDPNRPRIVILNYPANPTGATYRADRLKALAKVARKYHVVLLSDEIYGELHHTGQHVSIARFYPEGTIVSAGLSKWCGAGGWRLGTFTFPRDLRWLLDAMAAVASETYTSMCAPIQYAGVRAFQGGTEIEEYLWHSRHVLGALGRHIARQLQKAGVDVVSPQGAFYLFPDFTPLWDKLLARRVKTGKMLCERLLEEAGVALLPGCEFGRPEEELTARLSYVDFDGARALAGARAKAHQKLGIGFLQEHCAPVLAAIDRICQWLHP